MLSNLIYNAPSVRPQMWLARVEEGQLTLLTLAFILHRCSTLVVLCGPLCLRKDTN